MSADSVIYNGVSFRDRSLLRDQLYWPKPGKVNSTRNDVDTCEALPFLLFTHASTHLLMGLLPNE